MTSLPPHQVYYVSPDEIKKWQDAGNAVIVDVREQHEWDASHIPGAHLLPLSTFDPSEVPDSEGKHLVFHCRSGRRCGMAAEQMVAAGYGGTIERMDGGFLAWQAAGFPEEQ